MFFSMDSTPFAAAPPSYMVQPPTTCFSPAQFQPPSLLPAAAVPQTFAYPHHYQPQVQTMRSVGTVIDAQGHHHHVYSPVPMPPAPTASYVSYTTSPTSTPQSLAPLQPFMPVMSAPKASNADGTAYTPADHQSPMNWPGATPYLTPSMMTSLASFNASVADSERLTPDTMSELNVTPPSEVRFSSSKQKRSNKPLEIPPPAPGQTERLQLVVHYLAPEITDAGLRQLFGNITGFTHARIATESGTGRSRGFGYVWFDSQAAAMKAIEETNGRVLLRKRVRVVFAAPQSLPW